MPYAEGRVWLPSAEWFRKTRTEDWSEQFVREHITYPESSTNDVVIAASQMLYVLEGRKQKWLADERQRALPPVQYARRPPVPARRLAAGSGWR